jgi:signal transduction histidine kinase
MPVVGDAKLLFQVFSNLIANAVKYSPNGGGIVVEAATAADKATVSVTDRGIGIPAADLGRLFERYYRGSNVSGIVGTGVGLYLVKTAVDLHKGRIDVVSQEGSGSRFTVSLPLVPRLRWDSWKAPQSRTARDAPSIVTSSDSVT